MATLSVQEVLPPYLDPTSELPPLFDVNTRLYINYQCPFVQHVWVSWNYKLPSLDYDNNAIGENLDLIRYVDSHFEGLALLPDDPAKKEFVEELIPYTGEFNDIVYTSSKETQLKKQVPSLEHDNKVIGESLDLIRYIDSHFEGPALLPDDLAKKEFAKELIAYTDKFNGIVYNSSKGDPIKEASTASDFLETALHKFDDGPFFLGQFSQVDIAYAPFIERLQLFLQHVWNYDITLGRPKLAAWIEEINKIDAYKQTKCDAKSAIEHYKNRSLKYCDLLLRNNASSQ